MLYDIAHFWVALLLAAALGVAVGWFTRSNEPRHGPVLVIGRGWIFWAAVVFLVGLVLALVHALPDRPGLWLETALLLLVAYLVGCPLPGLLTARTGGSSTAHRSPAAAPVRSSGNRAVVPTPAGGSGPAAGPVVVPTTLAPAKPVADPVAKPVRVPGEIFAPTVVTPARSVTEPVIEPIANPVAESVAIPGKVVTPTTVTPVRSSFKPIATPAAEPVATPGEVEALRPAPRRATGIISDDPDAVDKPKR